MNQLVRAELLKLRTTKAAFWMLVGLPAAVALAVASSIANANHVGGSLSLNSVEGVRRVLSAASSSGGLIVLVLGIVGMAGEYRHQTATQTFLVVRRGIGDAALRPLTRANAPQATQAKSQTHH